MLDTNVVAGLHTDRSATWWAFLLAVSGSLTLLKFASAVLWPRVRLPFMLNAESKRGEVALVFFYLSGVLFCVFGFVSALRE